MPAKVEVDVELLVGFYKKTTSIDKTALAYTNETGVSVSRTLVKRRLVTAGVKLVGPKPIDRARKKKRCHKCGKMKWIKRFNRCRSRADGHSATCRQCWAEYQAERTLRRKFGMTPADYDAMLEAQSGGCAICGTTDGMVHRGRVQRLPVDHCHKTETVRGILCTNCNNGLGRFKDDPALLRKAADYLER